MHSSAEDNSDCPAPASHSPAVKCYVSTCHEIYCAHLIKARLMPLTDYPSLTLDSSLIIPKTTLSAPDACVVALIISFPQSPQSNKGVILTLANLSTTHSILAANTLPFFPFLSLLFHSLNSLSSSLPRQQREMKVGSNKQG